jgi:protein associated with RNAse G/E
LIFTSYFAVSQATYVKILKFTLDFKILAQVAFEKVKINDYWTDQVQDLEIK